MMIGFSRSPLASEPARQKRAAKRKALTLFEVVVAMAIFAISLIPIYQLITLATERAIDVKLQARTSSLCQSKMAEIIAGAQTLQGSGGYADYPDQKDIQWKMETSEVTEGLYEVKVWVKAQLEGGRSMESFLARLVLDPGVRGSTLEDPPTVMPSTPPTTPTEGATTGGTTTEGATTGGGTTGDTTTGGTTTPPTTKK